MVAYNKINAFTESLAEKVFNLGSDALMIAITNAVPAAPAILSDLTEISYTNLSSRAVTTTSSAQTGGTYKLVLADLVITASGAAGPMRYFWLYDNTATNKDLIGYWDYGASFSMLNGDIVTVDFDPATGALTIA